MKPQILILIGMTCFLVRSSLAEEFYINPSKGKDISSGSREQPFATLAKAVEAANALNGTGPVVIKLYPGLFTLTDKIDIHSKRKFTSSQRMIIEAVIMPDDPEWSPAMMPVIESIADTSVSWGFGCSVGLMASSDHITVRGLKFIGNANPNVGFYYPIGRESLTVEDLEISQCLFVGERYGSPIQVAVLTCGHQTIIDHCIFYNCRNAVVFWRVEKTQRNNSMTHCIVYGAYQSAIWTAKPDSNFRFHNNVITHSNFAWIKNYYNTDHYKFYDCVITENKHYRGEWQQPDTLVAINDDREDLEELNVIKTGHAELVDVNTVSMQDKIEYNYLNLVPGSLGYNLNAGLFKKNKGE